MTDVFTREKRSSVMARIRSDGNKATELRLVALLRDHRVTGWRRKMPLPPGKPDFTFGRERVVVFVDGCFWHACPRCFRRPGSNQDYWDAKIARNKERDREVARELRRNGWTVVRIWQHELKDGERAVARLQRALGRPASSDAKGASPVSRTRKPTRRGRSPRSQSASRPVDSTRRRR